VSAQDLEQRARELLAAEYERDGKAGSADHIRTHPLLPNKARAIRAIVTALSHQPAHVVDDARMARALEWIRASAWSGNDQAQEHLPTIEEAIATYDPNCGARTVRVVDDAAMRELIAADVEYDEARRWWDQGCFTGWEGISSETRMSTADLLEKALARRSAALARAQGVQP